MRYRIVLTLETPYNPNKWDWTELLASEEGEEIHGVEIKRLEGADSETV